MRPSPGSTPASLPEPGRLVERELALHEQLDPGVAEEELEAVRLGRGQTLALRCRPSSSYRIHRMRFSQVEKAANLCISNFTSTPVYIGRSAGC
jgi:hypothetical protein